MAPACSKSIVTSLRRERNAGTSFRRKMGYSATNPPGCRDLLGTRPGLGRTSRAPQPIALLVRAPEETSGTTMAWTQAGAEFKLSSKLDPSASRRKLAYYSLPASLSGAARPVHGLQRRLPTPRRSVNLPKLGRGICSADGPISICRAKFVWWWRANRLQCRIRSIGIWAAPSWCLSSRTLYRRGGNGRIRRRRRRPWLLRVASVVSCGESPRWNRWQPRCTSVRLSLVPGFH
jgi:hypothetical protein